MDNSHHPRSKGRLGKSPASAEDNPKSPTKQATAAMEPPNARKPAWFRDKDIRETVLIAAAIVLAAFTGWMAWETRQLAKDGNTQALATQKSVAIAESSMAMIKSNAEFAERTTKMEIRPYVAFDKIVETVLRVGQMASVRIAFVNAGKTPAYRIRTFARFKLATGVYQQDYDSLEEGATRKDEGAIGAGQTTVQLLQFRQFKLADSLAIASGLYRLHVYGRITYADKFGERHVTNYVWFYDPSLNEWLAYERYNGAD